MEKKKIKIGLVPKLIIAIIVGILFGQFLPEGFCRFVVTLSGFFSTFLKFVIPLMILAYVTMGIADLSQGAGKLLLITVALAYGSTLIAGSASYLVSSSLFPHFMSEGALDQIAATADASLTPFFSITLEPVMDTLSAVALAFVMGLCLSSMRGKEMGNSLYNGMSDFSKIIDKVLHTIIIPLLPLYICGTFTDMTISGKTFAILSILWKVFLVVIIMHLICITIQFVIAGTVSKKNPFTLIKNQIPGYTTALGTQSSAATIPVNLECAKKRRRVRADPQLRSTALCKHPHGRFHDHHHSLCYCSLPYEPAAHQSWDHRSVHHDSRCCHGCISRCSRWFHHDCPSIPLHGIRSGSRGSGRCHLCYHGCPLHYPGFLRNCLQCIR